MCKAKEHQPASWTALIIFHTLCSSMYINGRHKSHTNKYTLMGNMPLLNRQHTKSNLAVLPPSQYILFRGGLK